MQCRIVRSGLSVDQTSNAYVLVPAAGSVPSLPVSKKKLKASPFDGHTVRRSLPAELPTLSLAAIAAQRMASGVLRLGRCRPGVGAHRS
jgi:hypothetical protein